MKMTNDSIFDPWEIRRRLGLNQQEFWSRIGVTQSGGSRYENGRRMPRPVQELLRLVHVEGLDLSRVKRDDLDVLEYLRVHRPDVYQSARQQIAGKPTETVVSIQLKKPPIDLPGDLSRGHQEEMPPSVAFRR